MQPCDYIDQCNTNSIVFPCAQLNSTICYIGQCNHIVGFNLRTWNTSLLELYLNFTLSYREIHISILHMVVQNKPLENQPQSLQFSGDSMCWQELLAFLQWHCIHVRQRGQAQQPTERNCKWLGVQNHQRQDSYENKMTCYSSKK